MFKTTTGVAALMLTALGGQQGGIEPTHQLKEEKISIEYNSATNEATLAVEAESETALGRVEILNPTGASIFRLAADGAQRLALSGFVVESRESTLATLYANYAEGRYDMHARALGGELLIGGATLSHALPSTPVVTRPLDGDVGVSTSDLVISWVPDTAAAGYRVVLEQGESDGLAVELPRGSSSFRVPDGLLAPGTESHVEVATIAANGNSSMTEVSFTTR